MKTTLLTFLFSSVLLAQGTLSLSNSATPPVAGYGPGATVILNITKTGNLLTTGLQFDLDFPLVAFANASPITLSPGPVITAALAKTLVCGVIPPALPTLPLRCVLFGFANQTVIPDGVVVTATFTLAQTLPAAIAVTLSNPVEADASGNGLVVTVLSPISVSIPLRNRCDVSGNGSVGLEDSSALANVIALKTTATPTTDLDSNGVTDVRDAQIVATAVSPGGTCSAR